MQMDCYSITECKLIYSLQQCTNMTSFLMRRLAYSELSVVQSKEDMGEDRKATTTTTQNMETMDMTILRRLSNWICCCSALCLMCPLSNLLCLLYHYREVVVVVAVVDMAMDTSSSSKAVVGMVIKWAADMGRAMDMVTTVEGMATKWRKRRWPTNPFPFLRRRRRKVSRTNGSQWQQHIFEDESTDLQLLHFQWRSFLSTRASTFLEAPRCLANSRAWRAAWRLVLQHPIALQGTTTLGLGDAICTAISQLAELSGHTRSWHTSRKYHAVSRSWSQYSHFDGII